MENEVINPEPTPHKKNAFGYKSYTLTFFGALVSNLGNIFYSFAVSFYILKLTNNNAFIQGAYLATGGITYVLFTLFGGVISDRFHKGKIMFICDYLKGFMIIAFHLLIMLALNDDMAKIAILFVVTVLGNIIGAIFTPASSSLLPRVVPEELLQQGQSYFSMMQSMNGILGVILAGILYSVLPVNILFIIVGGCYIISGFTEMFINYNHEKKEDKLTIRTAFQDIGIGVKYLFSYKPLLYLIIVIFFINFFFSPITSNFIPYFVASDVANSEYLFKEFMQPEMWSSIISVSFGIGMIIMALIISTRKPKPTMVKGLRICFVLIDILLIAFSVNYFIYAKGMIEINAVLIPIVFGTLLIGLILPAINIPMSTKIMTIVDKDKLGKVSSVMDVGTQGLIPLSSFLAGIVISGIGASYLLIICAAGLSLLTIAIFVSKNIAQL